MTAFNMNSLLYLSSCCYLIKWGKNSGIVSGKVNSAEAGNRNYA